MYEDSILSYLDHSTSNQVIREIEDSDLENENDDEQEQIQQQVDKDQCCFIQKSKINREVSSVEKLSEQLINEEHDQDIINNDQYVNRCCGCIKVGKLIFFSIYLSNIFTVPLLYILTLTKDVEKETQVSKFVIQAVLIMILHFVLNFTMFMYGSIITGQGILLLIYLRQQENQIRTYLKSCYTRSLFFSIIILVAQSILFAVLLIQKKYFIEYFQKFPLIQIGRYVASFFISTTMEPFYSNQKVFKKRRLMSLYNKYYTKYYNEQKLEQELIKKYPNPNEQQIKQFLSYKQKQAICYLEKMEINLTQNKEFKLDQILTNKHFNIQLRLTSLYCCIFFILQIALIILACYFLWNQIPLSQYTYLSTHDYPISTNQFENIHQISEEYYNVYYMDNSKSCFDGDFYIESDSIALIFFNIFVLIQALLITFVRFSLKTEYILNENTRNRLLL
ncbi:hypothetical protein ABPG74_009029 [Tetrahymena malaccensis]